MTTEIFEGQPEQLKTKVDAIIAGGATSVQVVPTNVKATYLIMYS